MNLLISNSPRPFLIVVALGLMLVWIWFYESGSVRRSQSFEPETARITVVYYSPKDSDENFYYEGEIGKTKRPFRSLRISYGNVNSKESYSQFVKAHPPGSLMTVFVNPDDPATVIAEKAELHRGFWIILAAAVLLVIVGVAGLWRVYAIRRPT